ncbi:MAG: hypothetical protein IH600_15685 [Bacteroidetes bacterium]|nr:hypothetical protein [Bacteroidota bacterium]
MMIPRFTLSPGAWYAMEFHISNSEGYEHWTSPIKVYSVVPKGTGAGIFDLAFLHAAYPAGVRDKVYTLRTLLRTGDYIIAERLGEKDRQMSVILFDLQPEWLKLHFNIEVLNIEEAPRILESTLGF